MIGYKLTDQDMITHGNTLWVPGKTRTATGMGELCGPGWLHYYEGPYTALMMNPTHAAFMDPILWECEVGGKILRDRDLKAGCTELTLLRQLEIDPLTTDQCVAVGIVRTARVTTNPQWIKWAERWMSGEDRSAAGAGAARGVATWAARAASRAARAASRAARAKARAEALGVATWAARAALYAARATAKAESESESELPSLELDIEAVRAGFYQEIP